MERPGLSITLWDLFDTQCKPKYTICDIALYYWKKYIPILKFHIFWNRIGNQSVKWLWVANFTHMLTPPPLVLLIERKVANFSGGMIDQKSNWRVDHWWSRAREEGGGQRKNQAWIYFFRKKAFWLLSEGRSFEFVFFPGKRPLNFFSISQIINARPTILRIHAAGYMTPLSWTRHETRHSSAFGAVIWFLDKIDPTH